MPNGTDASYPIQFSVDYPDRELNRVSSAFRIIWVIPIAIVLAFLSRSGGWGGAGGVLFIPVLLMILFRQTGSPGTPSS